MQSIRQLPSAAWQVDLPSAASWQHVANCVYTVNGIVVRGKGRTQFLSTLLMLHAYSNLPAHLPAGSLSVAAEEYILNACIDLSFKSAVRCHKAPKVLEIGDLFHLTTSRWIVVFRLRREGASSVAPKTEHLIAPMRYFFLLLHDSVVCQGWANAGLRLRRGISGLDYASFEGVRGAPAAPRGKL